MKRIGALALFTTFCAFAMSQENTEHEASAVEFGSYALGVDLNGIEGVAIAANPVYSNTTNFSGFYYAGGGAGLSGANTITPIVADDMGLIAPGYFAGKLFARMHFSVVNANSVAVTARMRVRFYVDNGGIPGNYWTGFTFGATTFAASTGYLYYSDVDSFAINLPASIPNGKIWAAIQFDNNSGATGATAAQLNNLGQYTYDPPTVGTSQDVFFQGSTATNGVVNNPAGNASWFNGNPKANFYWGIEAVPEPATMAVFGLGLAGLVIRRRQK